MSLSGATIRDVSFSLSLSPSLTAQPLAFTGLAACAANGRVLTKMAAVMLRRIVGNHVSRWWRGAQLPRGLSDAGESCFQRSTCRTRDKRRMEVLLIENQNIADKAAFY